MFKKSQIVFRLCCFTLLLLYILYNFKSPSKKQTIRKSYETTIKTYFNQPIPSPGILRASNGGIGNQLFEYACAYALSKDTNWTLYSYANNYKRLISTRQFKASQREFALDQFQIPQLNLYDKHSKKFNVNTLKDYKFLKKLFPVIRNNQGFIQITGGCQSPEYFQKYEDEIKIYFQPSEKILNSMSTEVKAVLKLINDSESVAIHVRRGDFLIPDRKNAHFMPISYQRAAIHKIISILKTRNSLNPVFFVFSDDINYCKNKFKDFEKNFKFVYVSALKTNSIQDFYLMVKCKHAIIPNSTFSWWAAYLISNLNKIIIASAFNPEFWKKRSKWDRTMFGTMYHPVNWIVIDPFCGEEALASISCEEPLFEVNKKENKSRYHNTLKVDYVNRKSIWNIKNINKLTMETLREKIIIFERKYENNVVKFRENIIQDNDIFSLALPKFECPHKIETVVGIFNESAKYLCGLDIYKNEPKPKECVVYMFTDYLKYEHQFFIENLANRTDCHVYLYYLNKDDAKSLRSKRIRYLNQGIDVGNRNWKQQTLKSHMIRNGHAWIDFLFLDLNGRELQVIPQIMKDCFVVCPIGQMHVVLNNGFLNFHWNQKQFYEMLVRLIDDMSEKGFRLFHDKNVVEREEPSKEYQNNMVLEYAFINIRGKHLLVTGKQNTC